MSVNGSFQHLARSITSGGVRSKRSGRLPSRRGREDLAPVVGITGTGGAGKSSLTDELVRRFLYDFEDKRVAVVCADPTRRKTGGALLGDRIRFNTLKHERVFVRSVATRGPAASSRSPSTSVLDVVRRGFDLVILETAGIGQGDSRVADLCDVSLYVMTAEYGAPSQLEKIDMLDFADFVAINKFTRRGSEDALRDVRKQYQRNHQLFDRDPRESADLRHLGRPLQRRRRQRALRPPRRPARRRLRARLAVRSTSRAMTA